MLSPSEKPESNLTDLSFKTASLRQSASNREASWTEELAAKTAHAPGEIRSYNPEDGYLDMARRGIKLASLHKDREKYHFKTGALINIRCDEEGPVVPCRVLGIDRTPLKEVDPVQLAVNGFFSAEHAHARLEQFYAKEGPFGLNTTMVNVSFVAQNIFDTLSTSQRELLIKLPPAEALRRVELRTLTLPSIAQWVIWSGGTAADWFSWLADHGLAAPKEIDQVYAALTPPDLKQSHLAQVRKVLGKTAKRAFQEIWDNQESPDFKKFILLDPRE